MLWSFSRSSVRVESYETYNAPTDGDLLPNYRPGSPMPDPGPRRAAYYAKLKSVVDEGREVSRLRVVPDRLNNYLCFEIEWPYQHLNVPSGENLSFVKRSAAEEITRLAPHDFYIFDDARVVRIKFDDTVKLESAELLEDPASLRWYQGVVALLKRHSIPFQEYMKTFDPKSCFENSLAAIRNL